MRLVERMKNEVERLDSMFQAHLMGEDIARIERLADMAHTSKDRADFLKQGLFAGWTKDDMRTFELKEPINAFLDALWDYTHHSAPGEDLERRLEATWIVFNKARMKVLIGCL